jgi:hypothetical protein
MEARIKTFNFDLDSRAVGMVLCTHCGWDYRMNKVAKRKILKFTIKLPYDVGVAIHT